MADKNDVSTITLKGNEVKLLHFIWESFEKKPKIDWEKLAPLAGYTVGSAMNAFARLKMKIKQEVEPDGASAPATPTKPTSIKSPTKPKTPTSTKSSTKSSAKASPKTPTKTPTKRSIPAKRTINGDDSKTPRKKAKKQVVAKGLEKGDEVDEEERETETDGENDHIPIDEEEVEWVGENAREYLERVRGTYLLK